MIQCLEPGNCWEAGAEQDDGRADVGAEEAGGRAQKNQFILYLLKNSYLSELTKPEVKLHLCLLVISCDALALS